MLAGKAGKACKGQTRQLFAKQTKKFYKIGLRSDAQKRFNGEIFFSKNQNSNG
jgi:hypothetical protein